MEDQISIARLTILLADDDEKDVFLFKEAFLAANLANPLQVVRDGVEVTEYLSGHGKFADREKYPFPFMLLLDWKMPRMGGMETLIWIRKQERMRELWIVVLTAETERYIIDGAYELGANSYFAKPGDRNDWGALIERLHGSWLILPGSAQDRLGQAVGAI